MGKSVTKVWIRASLLNAIVVWVVEHCVVFVEAVLSAEVESSSPIECKDQFKHQQTKLKRQLWAVRLSYVIKK